MPTLATLIKILSTSLWAYFKSFGCFIEKNRKQVFSGHCLGSRVEIGADSLDRDCSQFGIVCCIVN